MRNLEISERFVDELNRILDFMIGNGDINNAINFHAEIYTKIENIPFMPFRHRQSPSANDKNIRELIYKGYKIPYRISDETIEILGIYKENLWIS